jgi:hypothetical protein
VSSDDRQHLLVEETPDGVPPSVPHLTVHAHRRGRGSQCGQGSRLAAVAMGLLRF